MSAALWHGRKFAGLVGKVLVAPWAFKAGPLSTRFLPRFPPPPFASFPGLAIFPHQFANAARSA
jgi:hypothetical protein